MHRRSDRLPELLPVLSTGRHRSPRRGACFMDASYLAGERWSDHPSCTHPLLATLARLVNDELSAHSRQRLVELIPSVIGLTSDDLRLDARIALHCATSALPVVPLGQQRSLAVSVLSGNRILAELDATAPYDPGGPRCSTDEQLDDEHLREPVLAQHVPAAQRKRTAGDACVQGFRGSATTAGAANTLCRMPCNAQDGRQSDELVT